MVCKVSLTPPHLIVLQGWQALVTLVPKCPVNCHKGPRSCSYGRSRGFLWKLFLPQLLQRFLRWPGQRFLSQLLHPSYENKRQRENVYFVSGFYCIYLHYRLFLTSRCHQCVAFRVLWNSESFYQSIGSKGLFVTSTHKMGWFDDWENPELWCKLFLFLRTD